MANYQTYGIEAEGTIGASKTLTFSDTKYEHSMTLSANTTLTFDATSVTPTVFKRLLRITMPSTVYSVTFPNNLTWNRGFPPCMNVASQTYLIEIFTYDGGLNWSGYWLCECEV